MKKFLSAILASTMILSLTACNNVRNTSSNSEDNSSSQSTESSAKSENTESIESSTNSENSESPESSESSKSNNLPDFTEEDIEFQKIFAELVDGVNEIDCLNSDEMFSTNENHLELKFPEIDPEETFTYDRIPDGYMYGGILVPTTREELAERVHKCIAEEQANSWIDVVGTGRLTENPDGTLSVNGISEIHKWLELDGRLYCFIGAKTGGTLIAPESAKIESRTDDEINFTYSLYADLSGESYESERIDGKLVLENDGWKFCYENKYYNGMTIDVNGKKIPYIA